MKFEHKSYTKKKRGYVYQTKMRMWWVRCHCGREVFRKEDRLLSGDITSCGCLVRKAKTADQSVSWKGAGRLSGENYRRYARSAAERGLEFSVTIHYLANLFEEQNGKCAITGLPIVLVGRRWAAKHNVDVSASLDRRDNTIGYVPGNVWWVHKAVNRMKWDHPLEEFYELCRLVTEGLAPQSHDTSPCTRAANWPGARTSSR
jgi:hypothetical protein